MQLTVKGKQLDVGDALRNHVEQNLTDAAKKYFNNAIDATVVFSKEAGHLFKADISIHVGKGIMLKAHYAADDPYPAFDQASERVAGRMRRYKEKLKSHHKQLSETDYIEAAYYKLHNKETEKPEKEDPMIVAEMATTIQSMSPSEAVMRMDLADLPALMFRNSVNGGLNMIYRRSDGHIGWVDPEGNKNKEV